MRTHMKTVPPFRRPLAGLLAILIAAAGVTPPCEAASTSADVSRLCRGECPGECTCGDECTCLTRHSAPAEPATPQNSDAPRVVFGLDETAAVAVVPTLVVRDAVERPAATLTHFPSLRTLEVRIQT